MVLLTLDSRFCAMLTARSPRLTMSRRYPKADVDALLGYRFAVVEIPQQRAVAAYAELQTITVSEDVILGRGFDSLELSIGEVGVLSRHEIVLRH